METVFNTTKAAYNPNIIQHWNKYVFRSAAVIGYEGNSTKNIVPIHYYELITKQNPDTLIDVSQFIMDWLKTHGYVGADPQVIQIINISYSTVCVNSDSLAKVDSQRIGKTPPSIKLDTLKVVPLAQ